MQHERNEVRFGVVVFADRAVGCSAGGVEITQGGVAPAVGMTVVGQGVFDHQLGESVRVDWRLLFGFGDRHDIRHAVGCAGAREHDPLNPDGTHSLQQRQRTDDVVVIILCRVGDRDPDVARGREVHDRFDFVLAEGLFEGGTIVQIADDQPVGWHRRPMALGEVVVNPDIVAATGEQFGGMGTDVPCPATQ